MNSMSRIAMATLACLMMSSCGQGTAPANDSLPSPSTGVPLATQVPAQVGSEGSADVTFVVDPAVVHACDGKDRVVSNVTWRVDHPAVTTIRVEVDAGADSTRKVFTAGGATGAAETGDWVVAGVRFHLVDAASGNELAMREISSLPCN